MAIPPGGEHESELKEQPYPSSSGRITKRFVFDKSKIIALRETFGSTRVTRFEAMFVLLWSAIQATKSEEDELVASIAVNLRKRMNPPIPEQCFGNICTAIMTNWPKEEITDRNSFAGKLRELIRMGSPYCKFFKWADSNEEIQFQLQEFNNELLNKEKELQKILDDVEKTKNELRKRVDDVEKRETVVSTREMVLLEKETELRHGRTLLWVYLTILFVIACYFIVSK
ncbi:hypothetical protein LWI28_011897 [Acer negundo]|uniref:Uncharacterized protein n=1 Tax=Acer negundo TaxID=4023 RepID=A0AAD5ILF2_ACENE|nr:hypothetical protein LWI28_011897 [Acer negundo]